MKLLTETYSKEIAFSLSCFDRLIITGTLPEISYRGGLTSYIFQKAVKIFDYPKFAEPFKELIRNNTESIPKVYRLEIEFILKSGVRKETIIISEKIKELVLVPAYCY